MAQTAPTTKTEPNSERSSSLRNTWESLWQTPDQRALKSYKEQDFQRARELFEDPQWKASSDYESGNFDDAAKAFAKEEGAQGQYNLGNALAQKGDIDGAINAYDNALAQDPDYEDAKFNKKIMEKLKQQQEQQQQNNQDQQNQDNQQQDSSESQQQNQSGQQDQQDQEQNNAEQEQQQNKGEEQEQDAQSQEQQEQNQTEQQKAEEQKAENQQGEETESQPDTEPSSQAEVNPDDLSDEEKQALEQWLKQVPDDPSGLLRRKFLHEQRQKQIAYRNDQLELPSNDAHKRY